MAAALGPCCACFCAPGPRAIAGPGRGCPRALFPLPPRAGRLPSCRRGCGSRGEVRGLQQGLVPGTSSGLPALPSGVPGARRGQGEPQLPWSDRRWTLSFNAELSPQPVCPMVTMCRKKSGWLPLRQRDGPDPDGKDGLPSAPQSLSSCSRPTALQACWELLPAAEHLWAKRRSSWSAAADSGTTSTEGTPAWRKWKKTHIHPVKPELLLTGLNLRATTVSLNNL
ncbi:uncharacterized protein LOC114058709 isoform X1 [Empidonax traillii]|uniref:uncharacterized protein LOC114058709 isoform X1 n=1 Tax=Empidonax traillii TaxID=164674 RepID=UPI000FFCF8E7|nr:uncharacterized protein LOC114058709 isoform X1 [Empidonax traillii]